MTPIRIRAEKDAVTPKSIHPHGQEIHLQKKENIMRSLPQRYTVTEQNDDVTDGIVGGRLLRIELWNMK